MKIGIDARCFIGNKTGVANNVYMLLSELIKIRSTDMIYLYASKDFDIPILSERIVKRIGSSIFSKSGTVWLFTEGNQSILRDNIDVFWGPCGLLPNSNSKFKTILTINDFVWKIFPKTMPVLHRLALHLLSRSAVSRANKVFTISEAIASELLIYTGRRTDAVIRPAASDRFYRRSNLEIEAIKKKYGISAPYYLIVGTLEPRKNLETFLRAYSNILYSQKSHVSSGQLVIAGGNGWKNAGILTQISHAEQHGWLKRVGYVDDEDLPALYSGADIFFMPSIYEGFGMPVLEARYCETPLVVADVPAMHEAGGDEAWYHTPTYDGICEVLEQILLFNKRPPKPEIKFVTWTWKSGALSLSKLIDEAFAAR